MFESAKVFTLPSYWHHIGRDEHDDENEDDDEEDEDGDGSFENW